MGASHGKDACVGATVTRASWPGLRFEFVSAPSGGCPEHAHDKLHVLHAVRGRFLQISETPSGRRRRTAVGAGGSYVVAAGQRHEASWRGEIETACLYFSDDFLDDVASDRPRAATPLDADTLARVVDFIEASLGDDLSLRAMARVAARSPSHFARTFRAATGVSPAAYVRSRRITRAQEALRDEDLSLAELAYRLGFASQAHFTTAFRRQVGMTPSAFRRAVARI